MSTDAVTTTAVVETRIRSPQLFVHVKGRRGLGHLCRQTAILRRLRQHIPSADIVLRLKVDHTPILEPNEFTVMVAPDGTDADLPGVLVARQPDVVLFDTVFPSVDPPDTAAFKRPPSGILTLRHIRTERFEDLVSNPWMAWVRLVIVPHEPSRDIPMPRFADRVEVRHVGPVLLERPLGDFRALSARYGVDVGDRLIVATVGGGGYTEFARQFVERVVTAFDRLRTSVPNVRLALIIGPSGDRHVPARSGIVVTAFEPELPTLFHAADVVVTHGGYNSSNEILSARTPSIFIPNAAKWDDTLRRARRFAAADFGLVGEDDPVGLSAQLAMLLDGRNETTRRIRRSLATLQRANGADLAARVIGAHIRRDLSERPRT